MTQNPTTNTEAGAFADVAAKLTKGERETLYAGCDVPRTNDEYSADCICGGRCVAALIDKGLAQRRGRYPNGTVLTPLGLAVRQHLEQGATAGVVGGKEAAGG